MSEPNYWIESNGALCAEKPRPGYTRYDYLVLHTGTGEVFQRTIYILGSPSDMLWLLNHWNSSSGNLWKYWMK